MLFPPMLLDPTEACPLGVDGAPAAAAAAARRFRLEGVSVLGGRPPRRDDEGVLIVDKEDDMVYCVQDENSKS